MITTGMWKSMLIESLITAIGPQVFTGGYNYKEYNYDYDITITYKINDLLCCFVWIKLYACIRTMLLSNKYTAP